MFDFPSPSAANFTWATQFPGQLQVPQTFHAPASYMCPMSVPPNCQNSWQPQTAGFYSSMQHGVYPAQTMYHAQQPLSTGSPPMATLPMHSLRRNFLELKVHLHLRVPLKQPPHLFSVLQETVLKEC